MARYIVSLRGGVEVDADSVNDAISKAYEQADVTRFEVETDGIDVQCPMCTEYFLTCVGDTDIYCSSQCEGVARNA